MSRFALGLLTSAVGAEVAPYLGQFANRVGVPNAFNSGLTFFRTRSGHFARAPVTAVKLLFPNFYIDGLSNASGFAETVPGGAATISAAIEYPAGTYTQVLFSGSANGTIPNGGTLLSDSVSITIPDNAMFWIRSYFRNASGIVFEAGGGAENTPGIQEYVNFLEGFDYNVAFDNTMGGAYDGVAVANVNFRPLAILSDITQPSVLIIGDSRGHGHSDAQNASGDYGEIARSIGGSYGYTNWSTGSYAASNVVASHTNLAAIKDYFSHVICQLGINDIGVEGASAATTLARLQSIWGYFSGKVIGQSTIVPAVTSNVDNTPRAYNAARVALNDLLRASPAGLDMLFELADVLEASRNSGTFGSLSNTADGVHESPAGYALLQSSGAINPALLTVAGGAWIPTNPGNLIGWFDFSDATTVTLNAGNVSQITNKGSGPNAANGIGANQPAYNSADQNGLNTATFVRSSKVLAFLSDIVTGANWTILLASKTTDNPVALQYVIAGITQGVFVGGFALGVGSFASGNGRYSAGSVPVNQNVWKTITYDPDHVWVNGVEQSYAGGSAQTVGSMTLQYIGARPDDTTLGVNGPIGEILIYNKILSAGERASAETYLNRWAPA